MGPRLEANRESVKATLEFLREICAKPGGDECSVELRQALISQGKLAKYENTEKNIKGMSLNTFKAVSDDSIAGGFARLDKLRREARERLNHVDVVSDPGAAVTQSAKTKVLKSLKQETGILQAANLVLLRTVGLALNDLRDIAGTHNEVVRKRLLSEAESRIHAALSVNSPPYDAPDGAEPKVTRISK